LANDKINIRLYSTKSQLSLTSQLYKVLSVVVVVDDNYKDDLNKS